MPTVDETMAGILAKRKAAHDGIAAAYSQLDAEVRAIAAGAVGRPLTADENARIKTLNDGMDALVRSDAALALDAVRRLNNSADAKALAASLNKVNADLTAKVDEIKAVSAKITEIGAVTAKIDGVVQGLASLAAML